jgi:hypothetical protein
VSEDSSCRALVLRRIGILGGNLLQRTELACSLFEFYALGDQLVIELLLLCPDFPGSLMDVVSKS